ncbi:hypothetical protein CHARACLAT_022149 [Characodon lateralis]|uniref:Uncharacterized protein n=1 Tax=Characodon lateralis TaxID=208331 RepID=A0ABU7DB11_9TELE|nr:hypothetical protein [Characodon lateralis]
MGLDQIPDIVFFGTAFSELDVCQFSETSLDVCLGLLSRFQSATVIHYLFCSIYFVECTSTTSCETASQHDAATTMLDSYSLTLTSVLVIILSLFVPFDIKSLPRGHWVWPCGSCQTKAAVSVMFEVAEELWEEPYVFSTFSVDVDM